MAKKAQERSQLLDLMLHVADLLGMSSDRELAALAEVSVDNIANWRHGTVKELKTQTLSAVKRNLAKRVHALHEQLRLVETGLEYGLIPMEVEESASPSALQRQFVDRMTYDYLGHRFLYFEPQGALAWENLIRAGYEQDSWLTAVRKCATAWFDSTKDGSGGCRGPIAEALGLGRRTVRKGLDIVGLGPGEGGKELIVLVEAMAAQERTKQPLDWATLVLVDVSIALLLTAAKAGKRAAAKSVKHAATPTVMPICADFEEGTLGFIKRLPSETWPDAPSLRLVLLLGNVFGNVRDEQKFLRQKLRKIVRPGDLLWLDVGLRTKRLEDDPLYRMTDPDHEPTAAFTNRTLLLEGPYRRWEAAIGRGPSELETRVWIREGDETCRIPGSINYCHDLLIKNERRVCTMLYSRRYELEPLTAWLEKEGMRVERVVRVEDSKQPVVHLLVRRL